MQYFLGKYFLNPTFEILEIDVNGDSSFELLNRFVAYLLVNK